MLRAIGLRYYIMIFGHLIVLLCVQLLFLHVESFVWRKFQICWSSFELLLSVSLFFNDFTDLWAGEEEAMEVEERWGDDDDVIDMDVDMSEEEQMALISEIHTTRNDLPLATSVGSVTQKAPFSLTNTVRAYIYVGEIVIMVAMFYAA